jgi:FkbM family methyltransferase
MIPVPELDLWVQLNATCRRGLPRRDLPAGASPLIVYGMGNGAEKILDVMTRKGIAPAGFFASDQFVRGHSFLGHKVRKLSEIEALVDEFTVLCAFGTNRPDVMEKIEAVGERHKLYAPDVPVCGETLFDRAFFEANADKIDAAYELFEDEKSKRLYKNIINFKLSGDIKYLKGDSDSLADIFGMCKHTRGSKTSSVYADLGAYDGDTVNLFANLFPDYEKIYAFEPQAKNFKKLREKTAHLQNVEYINAAAWDKNETISFSDTDNRNNNAFSDSGGTKVNAVRVDDVIENADIIKIDVEGAEREAITGLTASIENGAALIVSVYHRSEDIFAIPLMLKEMCPDYTFSLRKVPYIPAWDVFLVVYKKQQK